MTVVLAVSAVACSDDDDSDGTSDTTGGANELSCKDLNDVFNAIQGVGLLNSNTSVNDVQADANAIQRAWDEVKSSAEALAPSRAAAMSRAVKNLGDTIQNVSGSDRLADALYEVEVAFAEVSGAWTLLYPEELGPVCS